MHIYMKDTMTDMSWTDIQKAANENAIVLMPLGVIEEHGPHLCLGTDIYTAHEYCRRVKALFERGGRTVLLAPPFYWGVCQCTGGFIGSFQIKKETATALLYDILHSLVQFRFVDIYGINAHGDIDQSLAIMEAYQKAGKDLKANIRYVFDRLRIPHFGRSEHETYLCPLDAPSQAVRSARVPDIHAGDIETATIHHLYPGFVDTEAAEKLPAVALDSEDTDNWLFGGHIHELSPSGYLGSPSEFGNVAVEDNLNDYAQRIYSAIERTLPNG